MKSLAVLHNCIVLYYLLFTIFCYLLTKKIPCFPFRETTDTERKSKRKEYGIDFEDDYDYLQHLKPRAALSLEPIPDDTEVHVIEAKPNKNSEHVQVCLSMYSKGKPFYTSLPNVLMVHVYYWQLKCSVEKQPK